MPGLLGYSGSPGLLGGLQQIASGPNYGSSQGGGQYDQPTREEFEEYERAKQMGFQGTFEDWRQQKRHNAMLSAAQTQYQNAMPIKVFRPGIENPPHGFLRGGQY